MSIKIDNDTIGEVYFENEKITKIYNVNESLVTDLVFILKFTVTINQKSNETITVTTSDGVSHTSTFTCNYGTVISSVSVTPSSGYNAGTLSYSGFSSTPYTVTGNVSINVSDATSAEPTHDKPTHDIYIAYDAGDNGATYTFYDSNGNIISNPATGTAFRICKISGTPSSIRYYCAYSLTSFYTNNVSWSTNLYGTNIGTSEALGMGKSNTVLGIRKNTDTDSIFYKVNEMNTNKVYGYDDWFIPSYQEMVAIQNALPNASIWNKDGSQGNYNYIWTSSESSSNPSEYAWYWFGGYGFHYFIWGNGSKNYYKGYFELFPVRGF